MNESMKEGTNESRGMNKSTHICIYTHVYIYIHMHTSLLCADLYVNLYIRGLQ